MKYAKENARPETNPEIKPEINPETKPETMTTTREFVSLSDLVKNDKMVLESEVTTNDKRQVVKYCDIIDEEEFTNAIGLRNLDYIRNGGGMDYGSFLATHQLTNYMPKVPKRKRHIYRDYSDQPIEQWLYEYAFRFASYALRKKIQWSNEDTRIIKVYCGMLRNDKFENHDETVKDIVQEVVSTIAISLREYAEDSWRKYCHKELGDFADQFVFEDAKIIDVDKTVAIVSATGRHEWDYTSEMNCNVEIDLGNDYKTYKACLRSVDRWLHCNSSFVGGYNKKTRKSEISFDNEYISDTAQDYRAREELARTEDSVLWRKRRNEVLDAVGKTHGAGELRTYATILDLMHDAIIGIETNSNTEDNKLTSWQIDQIVDGIGIKTAKVTQYIKYTNVGKGKVVADYNYHITYRDIITHKKISLDLENVKRTLFTYLRAFSKSN